MSTQPDHQSTKPAFTYGPWEVHYGHDVTGYPCYFIHGVSGEEKRNGDRLEANARLIATAPELYVRLANLIEIVDRAGLLNLSNGVQLGQTSWYAKASDRLDAARAAIAKAEGGR